MVVGGVFRTCGESGHALAGIVEQFPERLGRDHLSLGVFGPRARDVGFVGLVAGLLHGRSEGLAPKRELLRELLRELHVLLCCVCARHIRKVSRQIEIFRAGRNLRSGSRSCSACSESPRGANRDKACNSRVGGRAGGASSPAGAPEIADNRPSA